MTKLSRRALVADDHGLYRRGLKQFLIDQLAFDIVYEAETFDQALAILGAQPDINLSLFDLQMPGMEGPGSVASLKVSYPDTKLAIVAASERKADVISAISLGLSGFIPKTLQSGEVLLALETILAGRIYVPALMLRDELPAAADDDGYQIQLSRATSEVQLTPRQKEVLDCLRLGQTNREIASQLGISIGTVKVHVATLLSLLEVRNRIQLIAGQPTKPYVIVEKLQ